ncbi:MAG: chromosomal replication initiator protein DnaA [Chlamydiota bacterium]
MTTIERRAPPKKPWTQFLSYMQDKCDAMEFNNWLSPISLVRESEEEVVLAVPNIFVQEYLLENFKEELLRFLPLSDSGKLSLHFEIREPAKKKRPSVRITAPSPISGLNQLYTFDNYIEGPSNQFVKSAAVGVAAKPGRSYNPLVIHGGVGLGKTHLLHGIGHQARKQHKKLRIGCITTEAFINDLVDHLRKKSVDQMKKHYRSLDLLLLDDIQFLQNRLNFEEEFCNTFESLIHQNKQIVITSDNPPSELHLSDRMIARMEWGLVANVMVPDLETRVAIVQYKAERKSLNLSNEVAFYIAENIYQNVRQIEGAVNRLSAYAKLLEKDLNVSVVEKVLGNLLQKNPQKHLTVDQILACVSAIFEVKVQQIKGSSRLKTVAQARQSAMYLAKEYITDSLTSIASQFGKTHSTLLHAWKTVKNEIPKNAVWERQIAMAERQLLGPSHPSQKVVGYTY